MVEKSKANRFGLTPAWYGTVSLLATCPSWASVWLIFHQGLDGILKATMCGTVIGLLLGVILGGLWSSLFGQPFSGATGVKVFHLGMFFPGLVIVAPVTAGIGAACGASAGWMRRRKGWCDDRDIE